MSKAIFISNGDQDFNQLISTFLLEKGYRVALLFSDPEQERRYKHSLKREWDNINCFVYSNIHEGNVHQIMTQVKEELGGLDVLIHGNEMFDEADLLAKDPVGFGEVITEQFRRIFLLNQAGTSMMIKKKSGHVLFPILYDALYYAGYPSSPIMNHGKISMMKCMSRELAPFKVAANVVTLGYYNRELGTSMRRKMKKSLEIFALKPRLPNLFDMLLYLEMILNNPVDLFGGQNIHVGLGIETRV